MTDEHKQPVKQEKEPALKRPDEAIKDLEPDAEQSEAVKGGDGPTEQFSFNYTQIKYQY